MLRILLSIVFILSWISGAAAQEIRLFTSGSIHSIQSAQHGKPYIMVLWSVDCIPCHEDLDLLEKTFKQHPSITIHLIAVDDLTRREEVQSILRKYHFTQAQTWIFADRFAERLRYEIDPRWYGETPRIYFYRKDGTHHTVMGKLSAAVIDSWLNQAGIYD